MDIAFKNLIYDYYSKDLSKKVKSAMGMKQEKAKFVNTVPYGYKADPADKHHLIIDVETAPIVRRIFMEVIGGKSCTQIAKELNTEGIPTPAQHKAVSRKAPSKKPQWTHRGLLTMIESVKYTGTMVTPQPPVQELTPPPEVHPTKAEWEDLLSHLYTLGYHTERQTGYLKKIDELLAQLPTRTQMEELLKAVKHLEQMSEQAGKRNEKRFSLPNIRRPRLRLLHLDGPTWAVLLMGTAALLLLWWGLGTVWSSLSLLSL